jgi:2-dehydropantoate 2-reductase
MKIAVLGAGAIGGLLSAQLIAAGNSVTVIDTGKHLQAIQAEGIRIIQPGGESLLVYPNLCAASCEEAGPHDIIFLAVKANLLEIMADSLGALLHDSSVVVTLQNGLPWWYFYKHGGAYDGYQFRTMDSSRRLAKAITVSQIIGAVAFPSAEVVAPGVIRHIEGYRFPLGELDGSTSPRVKNVGALLSNAGFKAPVLCDIRSHIWLKLLGNVSFNPISALTHATLEDMCTEPRSRELVATMMHEAKLVGERLGVRFYVSVQQRILGGERTGQHKSSTLQDVEAGRRLELAALLGSVVEVADLVSQDVPSLRMALSLLTLLDHNLEKRNSRLALQAL